MRSWEIPDRMGHDWGIRGKTLGIGRAFRLELRVCRTPAVPPCRGVCLLWDACFMKFRWHLSAAVALLGFAGRAAAAEPTPAEAATFEKHVAPFLGKYCYTCHNATKKRGDVVL